MGYFEGPGSYRGEFQPFDFGSKIPIEPRKRDRRFGFLHLSTTVELQPRRTFSLLLKESANLEFSIFVSCSK